MCCNTLRTQAGCAYVACLAETIILSWGLPIHQYGWVVPREQLVPIAEGWRRQQCAARDAESLTRGGLTRRERVRSDREKRGRGRKAGTGTAGSLRGTPGRGKRRDACRIGRTACVPRKPAFTGYGLLRPRLGRGRGLDCWSPLLAAAVFASAPAGAGWCDLSPPFAIHLTPFHLALRSAPALR